MAAKIIRLKVNGNFILDESAWLQLNLLIHFNIVKRGTTSGKNLLSTSTIYEICLPKDFNLKLIHPTTRYKKYRVFMLNDLIRKLSAKC